MAKDNITLCKSQHQIWVSVKVRLTFTTISITAMINHKFSTFTTIENYPPSNLLRVTIVPFHLFVF